MRFIGEWLRRLGYLLRRRALEEELRREMDAHRAQMGDARAFGNTLRLREEARDAWGWRWLDDLVQDTRFAWRTLRQSPGFTLTAMVTLALGIGVNIGMFSLINGLLLRPLYPGGDDVVRVHSRNTTPQGGNRAFSYPNYRDLQEGTTDIFADLAASFTGFVGLDVGNGPRSTYASAVSASYFKVFDQTPALGRSFTTEEERPGAGIRVAIISYPLWEQLGAGADTLGRLVRINGDEFTVVGVARQGFAGTSLPGPELWLPLGAHDTFGTEDTSDAPFGARETHTLSVVGRLRPDVPIETAEAALATVGRRLEQAFPSVNAGYALALAAPGDRLLFLPGGSGADLALLLMLMPVVVLLVASLNLADLLLARGHLRRQELAVRSSLGGGRSRLVRQLLTEGWLLALAGGAAGLLMSTWATEALLASLGAVLPVAVTLPDVSLDWRVLLGTIAFSLVATLVFGVGPALAQTRRAAAGDLKRHAGDDGRRRGVRLGPVLVIGQIALSVLLLASGGLFLMSVIRAASADPGFRLDGGVLIHVDPGLAGYDEAQGRRAHLALIQRLQAMPGVEAVTIGSRPPFTSSGDSREVAPAGVADASSRSVGAVFSVVGRDYARVLGLPLLAGRDFSASELARGSAPRVAIIDDALADELWPGEPALGRLIQFLDAEGPEARQPMEVVGIMPAVKHSLGNPRPFPHVYVPLGQHYESAMTLQIRLAGLANDRAMLPAIARVARDVDPRVSVLSVATWRDHLDAGFDVGILRAGAAVFSAFGGIALLLAVLGVYGVKSYVVSRRMREFGIRIAIGASPRALVWQVLREGGRLTFIGIGLGVLLALVAGQFLQSVLYGVNAAEPAVLVAAPLVLLVASLAASYLPALRATSVDPTVSLRAE
jgi:predicted permease